MPPPKQIILATIGSLGDLHPMIALAIELQQRGHRATIATTEFYRGKIEGIGIGFHPIRPDRSPEDPELLRHIMDLKKGPEFIIRQIFLPELRDTYDDLAAIAHDADLMIAGEIVFAAPLVAERFDLRWGGAILSPASFFSVHDPSVLAPMPFSRQLRNAGPLVHRAIGRLSRWVTRDWAAPVQMLRAELGLPLTTSPIFTDKFSPHFNLAMFSPVMGMPQSDWPSNTVQSGFVYYDRQGEAAESPSALRRFLEAGDPPIVFTLGSAAVLTAGSFYEESLAALRKLGRRGVLLHGRNLLSHNLPDGVAAFPYAPYSEILPYAAGVVHQGGIGTTAQVLRAGRPQLVMPYSFDQPDNGARVERLGVARTIGRDRYRAERVVTELVELLGDPAYARRAIEVARQVGREDGLRIACDEIERQLGVR